MQVSLIILGALLAVGIPLYLLHRRDSRRGTDTPAITPPPAEGICCGQHEVCEKTSLIADPAHAIEYFDDEELDRFQGRGSDDYTPDEIDEFSDVLLTMRPDEVAAWARSLQLRGITLPAPVREQLLMIVAESRATPPSAPQ